jgi:signal peptidase I
MNRMWKPSIKIRLGGALAAVTILVFVAAAVRIVSYRGWITPVRISGGSMAPAFAGEHWQRACADCGFTFRYDAAAASQATRIVCPNCGCSQVDSQAARRERGDRVRIDTLVHRIRRPRRWEAVALPDDQNPERLLIKRIVGLPGETIGIRSGDLLVDGRRQRKTLEQLRQLAVLVHDQRFRPPETLGLPPRWGPARDAQGWTADGDGFAYASPPGRRPVDPTVDWLEYTNWRCCANPYPRSQPFPVLDHLGYNQGTSRQLNPVGDLMLTVRVRSESNQGCILFRLADGHQLWLVRFDLARGTAALFREGTAVASEPLPRVDFFRGVPIEVAVCDARFLMQVAGHTVFQWAFERPRRALDPQSRPLAIGAAGAGFRVDQLRIYRDVFYLDPQGLPRDWIMPEPLPADRIFVLGDNPCISRDSRHGIPQGVPSRRLLGRIVPYW